MAYKQYSQVIDDLLYADLYKPRDFPPELFARIYGNIGYICELHEESDSLVMLYYRKLIAKVLIAE